MPTTINEAFKKGAMRAEYEGKPAMVLPVDASLAAEIDQEKIKQGVSAGQMLLSWNEGEKRHGTVINADARTDVTFLIKRNDGSDLRVGAENMANAVIALVRAEKSARENAVAVAEANEKAREDYTAAIERGDTPAEPVDQDPEFGEDAFARIAGLVTCVKESQLAIKADPLADIAAKAAADGFTGKLRDATRSTLTAAEQAKADEARALRSEIAMLNADHKDAANAVMPSEYEGDGEAARELMADMPHDPTGISAAQQSAMAANGDMGLVRRLFSVATTTPVMAVQKAALSHTGFSTYAQKLAKFENKEASEAILPRMSAVTKDAMEGYNWKGKIYTKDGADILLMRDEYAAFAYAWDSESRVAELNVEATVLQNLTQEDVPSEDDLEDLRAAVAELRHDNGAEVNFDWDDEPEDEPEVFDA
jgi:hypothetical protein